MKKIFIITSILFFFLQPAPATNKLSVPGNNSPVLTMTPQLQGISDLKIKQVEKLLGRKLTFKEKLGIKFYQWKIKRSITHGNDREYKDKGKTALLFGIIGLASLLLSPVVFLGILPSLAFGFAALWLGKKAKKENPHDKKAQSAITLGWITLGIITAATVFIVIYLSTLSWGIK